METPQEESFGDQAYAQLRFWQELLRLQDWNIELRIVRQFTLDDPDTLAECEYYLERKDAIIRIVIPEDLDRFEDVYLGNEARDYDITLVHELLHLHFAQFAPPEDEVVHEQVINTLSRAFVKLYRIAGPEQTNKALHVPGYL